MLNRLRRYLDGDTDSRSSAAGSQGASSGRKASSSAAGGGKASARGETKQRGLSSDSSSEKGGTADSSEGLGPFSERVAAAALSAVEGGAVPGLTLGPAWRSEVAGWSQVGCVSGGVLEEGGRESNLKTNNGRRASASSAKHAW